MSSLITFPSAGHNLKDPGASYGGRVENKETMKFRNLLVPHLISGDVSVITDKDSETNREYLKRIKPGTGSVVLDIHFNAGPSTASGTECYVKVGASERSKAMAKEICDVASKLMGIPNRGVKPENQSQHSRIGVLNTNAGVSALWEICFISNKNDMAAYDKALPALVSEISKILKKYDDLV